MKFKLNQDVRIANKVIRKGSVVEVVDSKKTANTEEIKGIADAFTRFLVGDSKAGYSQLSKFIGVIDIPEYAHPDSPADYNSFYNRVYGKVYNAIKSLNK